MFLRSSAAAASSRRGLLMAVVSHDCVSGGNCLLPATPPRVNRCLGRYTLCVSSRCRKPTDEARCLALRERGFSKKGALASASSRWKKRKATVTGSASAVSGSALRRCYSSCSGPVARCHRINRKLLLLHGTLSGLGRHGFTTAAARIKRGAHDFGST